MNRYPPFLAALAIVPVWHPALAVEYESTLENEVESIVVTASRLDRSVAEVAQSATIIERAQIEAYQVASVAELLRSVAGINVVQQGSRGGVTSIVTRSDIDGAQVQGQVTGNGHRACDGTCFAT